MEWKEGKGGMQWMQGSNAPCILGMQGMKGIQRNKSNVLYKRIKQMNEINKRIN